MTIISADGKYNKLLFSANSVLKNQTSNFWLLNENYIRHHWDPSSFLNIFFSCLTYFSAEGKLTYIDVIYEVQKNIETYNTYWITRDWRWILSMLNSRKPRAILARVKKPNFSTDDYDTPLFNGEVDLWRAVVLRILYLARQRFSRHHKTRKIQNTPDCKRFLPVK